MCFIKPTRKILFLCLLLSSIVGIGQNSADSRRTIRELFRAIKENNIEAVKQLVQTGANINQLHNNQTPLYYAVYKNKEEIVKILLANGANVNYGMPDISSSSFDDGWSPLQNAAFMGKTEIVKLLLAKKPNVDAIMKVRNQTALDMAIQKQNTQIINLIREARRNQLGNVPEREYHSFDAVGALLNLINTAYETLDKESSDKVSVSNSDSTIGRTFSNSDASPDTELNDSSSDTLPQNQNKETNNRSGHFEDVVCSFCHGTGKNPAKERPALFGLGTDESDRKAQDQCPICKSWEIHYHKICPSCNGKGYNKQFVR